ncbi:MAG: tRNA dihydrouridine synthase DusB [Clostridia bacterium]|nr:tRNA dihydrouridine synthase DusB [Clostridia bacterium]MBR6524160.1 tRNA dihydrouridine synthase DusB [Clostridia bacterium]
MKIKNLELKNNVFLAPMAGVTDKAFRLITKPFGPALMYTEMVSGKGLFYKNKKTADLLDADPSEKPVAAQLFGHEPSVLAQIAERALDFGAELIDINMGCPAPKIVNNGDGSAISKTPALAGEIVSAVTAAVNVPVTVKIRKGWDENSITAVEMAKIAEAAGASAVTVHGRTREQFYSGHADLDIIKAVKSAVSIPVIGNGDIVDEESAKYMLDYTGCDGIMIGRAAEGNPWIFERVIHYLQTNEKLTLPTLEERAEKMNEHLSLLIKFKGAYRGIQEARKHMAWYIKGMPGGARLREIINTASTEEEMREVIKKVFDYRY